MLIVTCSEHREQGYPPTIEGTPTTEDWTGVLSATHEPVPQPGGVPRTMLVCHRCEWADGQPSQPDASENALLTVGDPTLHDKARDIIKRHVASEQVRDSVTNTTTQQATKKGRVTVKTEPAKKVVRKRGKAIGTRQFGSIGVECRLVGATPENWRGLTVQEFTDLRAFLDSFKAEAKA